MLLKYLLIFFLGGILSSPLIANENSKDFKSTILLFENSESPEFIEKHINSGNFKNFEYKYLKSILNFYKKNFSEAIYDFKNLLSENNLPADIIYKSINFIHICYLNSNDNLSSLTTLRDFLKVNSSWENKHFFTIIKNYFEILIDNSLNDEYINFFEQNFNVVQKKIEFNFYLGRYYFLKHDFSKAFAIFNDITYDSRSIIYKNICSHLIDNDSNCHLIRGISYLEPNSEKKRCIYNAIESIFNYYKFFFDKAKMYENSTSKNNWLNVINYLKDNNELYIHIGQIDFDALNFLIYNDFPILLNVDIDNNMFSTDHVIVVYGKITENLYAVAGLQNSHIEFCNTIFLKEIWKGNAIIIIPKSKKNIILKNFSKKDLIYSEFISENFVTLSEFIKKNDKHFILKSLKNIETFIAKYPDFILKYPDFLFLLIQAYEITDDKKKIKINYEKLISMHYDKKNVYSFYGQFLLENKYYKEAKNCFLKSIEFGSEKANNYLFSAIIYFDEKDYNKCGEYLNIAEKLNKYQDQDTGELLKKMQEALKNVKLTK
ncbi:hypothetical protein KA977_01765 [Candidatus Dependentiae bacterium]|nr:hypothetical protein [Candidatus Dependentiae bacterium]